MAVLSDPGTTIPSLINRSDETGNSWVTLYEHRSVTGRYEGQTLGEHGLTQQEFRFLMCIVIAKSDRKALVEYLSSEKALDVWEWDPLEFTDGPFLREAPWRNTWSQEQWRLDVWGAPKGTRISFPACEYHWESHLDASLPEGGRALIPSPWLVGALSLTADERDASLYRDKKGNTAFIGSKLDEDGSSALIDARLLNDFLDAHDLQCVWLFVGERNVWPGGNSVEAAWRRSEGLCWLEDGKPASVHWKNDNANGASKAVLSNPAAKRSSKGAGQRKRQAKATDTHASSS